MLLAAALLIIVLWASIATVLVRSHTAAFESERRVLQRMSLVVEEQARYLLSTVQAFLFNADQLFKLRPDADPRTDPEFMTLVESLRRQSNGYIDIRMITQDGDLYLLPSLSKEPLANLRDRNYFQAQSDPALRGLFVGHPVVGRVSGRWLLPISYPLTGKPHGISVIFAAIESQAFDKLYEEGRTKPNGSIGLVHRDGSIIARAPDGPAFLGKSIANGEIWTRHLAQRERATVRLPAAVIDSQDRLTTYAALRDFPLVVVASSAVEDILADWTNALYWSLTFGALFTLLTVMVAWRLIRLLASLAEARGQVEDQALRDSLTGLPNRRMFQDRLEQAIKKADRFQHSVALLFIDLDLFKEVNDTLGHSVGDLLLKNAATRLLSSVRESDTIARLGGDEFTIIMSELSGPSSVERVAEAVLSRLAQPFRLGDEVAWISASIGITFYPEDAHNAEDLIKNADQAMYAAKNEGRNRHSYFTRSMQVTAQHRKRLLDDLRDALQHEQFLLHYQPIVDLRSGRVAKAEALIRWQHPMRGLITPDQFIPLLEETGMISEVGDWVFREAANQVHRWRTMLDPEFQVSINKSPAQFRHGAGTMARWERCLESLQLPGRSIAIEITEGLLMDVNDLATTSLMQISRAGIALSLDDFGTGYSSLSYLKKFDIDYIKIDRSFIGSMESDPDDVALCEAIIVMAHKLGLKVIAEGVENEAQRKLLALIGCDFGQGYFFSPPVAPADFEAVVQAMHAQSEHAQAGPGSALSDR